MQIDIINIINKKLYNYNYINYTIIFYIIIFYSYYSLFDYIINNNYIMIILYFILLTSLYKNFNKFSYIICYVFLVIIKIFNFDYFILKLTNNKIIENQSNIANNEEKVTLGGSNTTGEEAETRSKAQADDLRNNAKNVKSENNPCESYITHRLQELGLNVKTNSNNMDNKKKSTQNSINEILQGQINTSIANNKQRLI